MVELLTSRLSCSFSSSIGVVFDSAPPLVVPEGPNKLFHVQPDAIVTSIVVPSSMNTPKVQGDDSMFTFLVETIWVTS